MTQQSLTLSKLSPLPSQLIDDYRLWHANSWQENQSHHERLSSQGQKPHSLVISCCDSRVDPVDLFQANAGQLFVHRNIANFVPDLAANDAVATATAAVVEFALNALDVSRIVLIGHSQCGGIKHACDCAAQGFDSDVAQSFSHVSTWIKPLARVFADDHISSSVHSSQSPQGYQQAEIRGLMLSCEHLLQFAPVANAVEKGALQICALWYALETGKLHSVNPASGAVQPL